ncbi:DUF998 domain-containing protein [Pimelobacter simplex]|uniref:Uncharacterized protein n=1 Tax=Nocardioides simplex TaxID=2045 RepID=A0A0C5XKN1_NOCSI|nr:DUF998 domain-containing protein [Pimelobacter simplex]AJR18057.1 hypothetical protein KR76_02475 [Pimelobacter simplex]MCG8150857.1 DUF998 domain-containing protein [Pimelobacter simplex]GEB12506.1 hypothetical protein NSI01_08210 [Pimelobacter simplex]SFM94091.1 Protein of unknown function [Pimelobacter simplex]
MSAFRRRLARRLSMALLVTGGLVYASWVLQFVLPVHIDPVTSFISELSAVGQPFRRVFRTLDLIGGALLLVGGATAWWQSRRWPGVWAPLVVLGVCIVLEALLPLDASFTDDLPDPGTGSWWARITEPHGVISFVETNAFLVLLVTCSLALRRIDAPLLRRRALATVGVLAALSGLVDAALTAALLVNGDAVGLGLVQRLGVTLTATWLALAPTWLLWVTLHRRRHGEAASPAASDAGSQAPPSDQRRKAS